MSAEIIVAIICNLVAALVLICGLLSSNKSGWRVSLSRLVLVLAGVVGTYFLTPVVSSKVLGLTYTFGEEQITLASMLSTNYNISEVTVKSCVFLLIFLAFVGLSNFVCSIIRVALIRKIKRGLSENRAKIRRARSINPKAEKAARRTAKRALIMSYIKSNIGWKRFSCFVMEAIVSLVIGVAILMPYGYIAKDINHNGDKSFLVKGYEYTLNGVLDKKGVLDWIVKEKKEEHKVEDEVVEEVLLEVGEEEVIGQ